MMKRYSLLILVVFVLLAVAFPVSGSGNKEAGQPEPVEMKEDEAGQINESDKTESDASSLPADYPPEGWVTDIREAYSLAQDGDKDILVNFTGSDWCAWCKKLVDEVFSTPEFQAYADENLVMLYLDFPQGISLPAEQVQHNQFLAQLLGVQGYPTLWLLASDFSPLLKTGYQQGGGEAYARHLEQDRPDVPEEEVENFRNAFTAAVEETFGSLD